MKPHTFFAGLALSALFLATIAFAQDQQPGAGTTVTSGMANWDSALPVEAIVSTLLEELGYDVPDANPVAPPIGFLGIIQGDLDYWPNTWWPQQVSLVPDDFEDHATNVATLIERGAIQGYMASKDAVDEYDIESLADFARPEVREAFDPDGNGTVEMLGCIPGWACSDIIRHHLDVNDLQDVINVQEVDYAAGFADVQARYRAGEPVLYYAWTPNFTHTKLVPGEDVMWLNIPEGTPPAESQEGMDADATVATDVKGAVTDPIDLGFTANDIMVTANNDFLADNPAAEALFQAITIPLAEVTAMAVRVSEGENSPRAVQAMADEWIAEHRDEVDAWLQAAREAAD